MRFLELAGNFKRSPEWDIIRDIRTRGGIVHDLTKLPIPWIEDETYDGVHSEHFIEHMTKEQGIDIMREMYRVMKPGATIRTVWPSMDFVDQLLSDQDMSTNEFVWRYNQFIIDRENPFRHPYYQSIVSESELTQMSKQKKAAIRLLHQEGEHKHLWYKQEFIEMMKNVGFREVKEQAYRVSSFAPFNAIDNPEPMRPHHSTVVEAIK